MLRSLTLRLAAWQFISGGLYSMAILYAVRYLGATLAEAGFLSAFVGIGALIGATTVQRNTIRLGIGRTIVVSNLVGSFGGLLLPLAMGHSAVSFILFGLGLFIFGACVISYQVPNASVRQALAPSSMLGRVTATTRTLTLGMSALGATLIGLLAAVVGLRDAMLLAAVLGVIFAIASSFGKPLRELETLPS